MSNLPKNAHVSQHPCLQAKLSQLRAATTSSKEVQSLVHEIALMVGYEALAKGLSTQQGETVRIHPLDLSFYPNSPHSPGPACASTSNNAPLHDTTQRETTTQCPYTNSQSQGKSPLGYPYTTTTTSPAPSSISLVPILRSGLSMVSALTSLLPEPVPVHHLGLYREKSTLQPVEYYNNLPYHSSTTSNPNASGPSELAIVLDPVIATGATASAAIDSLKDWGVKRIIVIAVLATEEGLRSACGEWEEGVEVWVGGCDGEVDEKGMIKPGLGDIGDRLFLTIGK